MAGLLPSGVVVTADEAREEEMAQQQQQQQQQLPPCLARLPANLTQLSISDQDDDGQESDLLTDDELSRLSSESPPLPPQTETLNQHQNVRISVVISHCSHSLEWLSDYVGGHPLRNLTVVSKCGKEVK